MKSKIMEKKELKNYAFIDSQNLNLGIQNLGWKLDFKRFRIYLKDKYNIFVAYLFIGYEKAPHKDETLRGAFSYEFYYKYSAILLFVKDMQFMLFGSYHQV